MAREEKGTVCVFFSRRQPVQVNVVLNAGATSNNIMSAYIGPDVGY